jgi:hypothetical protein
MTCRTKNGCVSPSKGAEMPFYEFKEFLKLSSVLNYNLSAASLNRYNILLFFL